MDDWSTCSICNFTRDSLLEMPCCKTSFCKKCLSSRATCYRCNKVFDINDCISYQPLETLLSDVLIECRHDGCNYKSTEFLIQSHEKNCKQNAIFNSELIDALMDPSQTPKAHALQRKKNIFSSFKMYDNVKHIMNCMENGLSLNDTPLNVETKDGFYTHIILEGDTLAGIAIKYGVSKSEIKETNRLFSDSIHERTALRIPARNKPTFSEAEAEGLEKLLRHRLIARFRRKTGIKTSNEAIYYLENANMDIEEALKLWIDDTTWEKTAPPFKSILPSCHDELELFEKPQHKRGCCSLVF